MNWHIHPFQEGRKGRREQRISRILNKVGNDWRPEGREDTFLGYAEAWPSGNRYWNEPKPKRGIYSTLIPLPLKPSQPSSNSKVFIYPAEPQQSLPLNRIPSQGFERFYLEPPKYSPGRPPTIHLFF
jgi:hypothetical protein